MSDPLGGDDGYTGGQAQGQNEGGNPAWQPFWDAIPQGVPQDQLKNAFTPVLQEWDRNVNNRFETIQSQVKPWEPVVKSGMSPDEVLDAANFISTLRKDPKMVYDAIGQYYGLSAQQVAAVQSGQGLTGEPSENDPYAEKFTSLEQKLAEVSQHNEILARAAYAEQQNKMQASADADLERELTSLKGKYGSYDENYVLAMMSNGTSGEDAVKAYKALEQRLGGNSAPRPLIMGGGGGIPGNSVDPKKLNSTQTQDLVANMLAEYKRASQ